MYVVVKFSCFSKCGYEGGNAQATSVCNTLSVILHLSSHVEKLDVPGKERNCQTVGYWLAEVNVNVKHNCDVHLHV